MPSQYFLENTKTDVRTDVAHADGGYERRVETTTVWRVSLPQRLLALCLLLAVGTAVYAFGGEQALTVIGQWLRAATGK